MKNPLTHILVVTPDSWGLAHRKEDALLAAAQCSKKPLGRYVVYRAERSTFVDALGNLVGFRRMPEEIERVGFDD